MWIKTHKWYTTNIILAESWKRGIKTKQKTERNRKAVEQENATNASKKYTTLRVSRLISPDSKYIYGPFFSHSMN